MARKSKGKFTMKGCSPFKKEDRTKLASIDIETPDQDANKAAPRAEGQSEIDWMTQQLGKLRNRLKAKRERIENPSGTLEEQTTKYDVTEDAVLAEKNVDKMDEEFQSNAPKANLDKKITSTEVKPKEPDFSTFESVNDLVAERKLWEKENPGVRFPGQEEINKRLKENPNKWD